MLWRREEVQRRTRLLAELKPMRKSQQVHLLGRRSRDAGDIRERFPLHLLWFHEIRRAHELQAKLANDHAVLYILFCLLVYKGNEFGLVVHFIVLGVSLVSGHFPLSSW